MGTRLWESDLVPQMVGRLSPHNYLSNSRLVHPPIHPSVCLFIRLSVSLPPSQSVSQQFCVNQPTNQPTNQPATNQSTNDTPADAVIRLASSPKEGSYLVVHERRLTQRQLNCFPTHRASDSHKFPCHSP